MTKKNKNTAILNEDHIFSFGMFMLLMAITAQLHGRMMSL